MFCQFCGKQLPDGSKFCQFCGGKQAERGTAGTAASAGAEPVSSAGVAEEVLAGVGAAINTGTRASDQGAPKADFAGTTAVAGEPSSGVVGTTESRPAAEPVFTPGAASGFTASSSGAGTSPGSYTAPGSVPPAPGNVPPTTGTIPPRPAAGPGGGTGPAPGGPYGPYVEKQRQEQFGAQEQAVQKKKKSRKMVVILAVVAGVLVVAAFLSIVFVLPMIKYQSAVSSMDKGDYEKAATAFAALDDYKDAAKLEKECRYQLACQLLDDGEYEDAMELFDEIGDYSDAEDKLAECQYGMAKEAMDDEDYNTAVELLTELGDYEDAQELLIQCYAGYGDELYDDGQYKDAIDAYVSGGVTVYDNTKFADCYYQLMLADIEAQNWESAYANWTTIKDIVDTGADGATVLEQYIPTLIADGTEDSYNEALALIAGLNSQYVTDGLLSLQEECNNGLKEIIYQEAIAYYNSGDYENAMASFALILDYKDAYTYYSSMGAWTVTVVINNSESDYYTDMTSISKYDTIYAHFSVSGGDSDGVYLWAQWTYSDGDVLDDSWDDAWYDGDSGWTSWWYESPSAATGCTATISIYDETTGVLLATDTVEVY